MGGIENFLSRLLKDKIPRYHSKLPCSDFYNQYFTEKLFYDIMQQARSQKILLSSAFEEKVDLLMLQYSPRAVEEFI